MDQAISRVAKWIAPCLLFLYRDEILSLLALAVMMVMVFVSFLKAGLE